VDSSGKLCPKLELIVDRSLVKRQGRATTEVLIRWHGASLDDDTWELLWTLQTQYLHLLGKML
jgi:hypothetical protein